MPKIESYFYNAKEDKRSVILDVGSMYLKCGFSGEAQPRCIIPDLKCSPWTRIRNLKHDISPYRTMKEVFYEEQV